MFCHACKYSVMRYIKNKQGCFRRKSSYAVFVWNHWWNTSLSIVAVFLKQKQRSFLFVCRTFWVCDALFILDPLCLVNFQFSTLCSCVASLRNGAETHIGHFLVVWPHFCLLTIYREKYEGLWKWTFLKTSYKPANLRNPPLLPFWRTVGRYRSMSFLENTSTRTITWWKQITKLVLTSNMATQGAIKRHKQIGFHFPTQASRNSVHKPKEKVYKGCLWDLYVKTL